MYKVYIKKSALKELRKLPQNIKEMLKNEIFSLRENPLPTGCKKVRLYENCYRIRKGEYRILYEIKVNDTLVVFKIGHRKAVY
jgi:mRNA interferase RelE/StbE